MAVRVRNSSRVCVRGHEVGPSWFGDQRGCPEARWSVGSGRAPWRAGLQALARTRNSRPVLPQRGRVEVRGMETGKRCQRRSLAGWQSLGLLWDRQATPVAPSGPQRPQGRVRKALESTQASARAGPAPGPHAGGGSVLRHGGTCPRGRSLHRPPVTRGWGTRRTRSGPLPAPGRALRGFGGRGRPGAIEGAARCVPQPESCVDGATPLRLDPCTLPWTSQKQV